MIHPFLSPVPGLKLVGLTGPAGSGKDSAADHLCAHYGFVRAAFADPIRDMLAQLLEAVGVDHAVMTERHLKEQPLIDLHDKSSRQLMQTLGTEWGRKLVGVNLWVRAMEVRMGLSTGAPVNDRIVITDVRFANEAEMIKAYGGEILAIERPWQMLSQQTPLQQRLHVSEFGIPLSLYEHVISNDGTLGQLQMHVDSWARCMGLDEREAVEP
jgi:hypothetical protein